MLPSRVLYVRHVAGSGGLIKDAIVACGVVAYASQACAQVLVGSASLSFSCTLPVASPTCVDAMPIVLFKPIASPPSSHITSHHITSRHVARRVGPAEQERDPARSSGTHTHTRGAGGGGKKAKKSHPINPSLECPNPPQNTQQPPLSFITRPRPSYHPPKPITIQHKNQHKKIHNTFHQAKAKFVCDLVRQCARLGELRTGIQSGLLKASSK